MSVTDAFYQAQATDSDAAVRRREIGRCYRAVFYGTPQPTDQDTVREDLEQFCGMRSSLLRPTFEDTAHAVGQFRVWQRIVNFCFPLDLERPKGESHGSTQVQQRQQPIAGGGVADRTLD